MARKASRGRRRSRKDDAPAEEGARSLPRALALTLASGLLWGVAHLWAGRRVVGALLVSLFTGLVAAVVFTVTAFREDLAVLAVQPQWLTRLTVGLVVLGAVWIAVLIRSYQIVRPRGLTALTRTTGAVCVTALCAAVSLPLAWAAHLSQVSNNTINNIFTGTEGRDIDADDPWEGRRRVNVLLLGGDAGPNRVGVRTDSMTVASVDTRTGDTVLLSLPRNLENAPMPPGPARDRFPYGFTGDGPLNPGLLNEVYEYAENHPDVVPGIPKERRGPELLKGTIATILDIPIDYYILIDMRGFADVIDAMGGVRLTVPHDIVYGRYNEGVVKAGTRTLSGAEALWFGRSRTFSDDYARMSRQKCLLLAVARQADPQRVLTRFSELAAAAERAVSTDIPSELLPALVKLSAKVRDGAKVTSLQFVPPLINTGNPDYALIRSLTARALAESEGRTASPSPSRTGTASPERPRSTRGPGAAHSPRTTPSSAPSGKPVSLDETC
ncbi:LCP family protein [Thermomonospora catenispora]|uniref:LCP family protein n=1 Tax=Thermomonospora catenispora TaxID=2493090 RepID=UPI00111CD4A8|nr:LCP family protein [Thermomonospora catenispora]TNY35061.1 LytR family transcriptional regulator [Thermomonospora catenispora]